jgi:hypothetical protein
MKNKTVLLIFLLLCLSQVNLISLITSRIEGTVLDAENELPILKAKIALFKCTFTDIGISCNMIRHIETDSNGKFKFDDILKGKYFLSVFKEGYAAFGPLFNYYKIFVSLSYSDPFGSLITKSPDDIKLYNIREGQIKHFVIKMEKEAILKVNIIQKLPNGIEISPIALNRIIVEHHDFLEKETVFIGNFPSCYQSKYFRKGFVSVEIRPLGYPSKKFEKILLQSGETTTIDYILDFTQGQILHGFIKDKSSIEPLELVKVFLSNPVTDIISATTLTDKDGEFLIGGIEPGKYILWISYSRTKEIDHEEIVEIKQNEKKEIIREF